MTRPHPARALPPLLALLLLPLVACSDDPPHYSYDAAADAAHGIDRILRARERAVRSGNEDDFLRTVVADPAFEEEQTTYFENLEQLPVGTFRYRLDRSSLERNGDTNGYWGEVEVTLRLQGYDVAPVRTRDRLLFQPGRGGKYRLASATDKSWEQAHLTGSQPWDIEKIDVREDPGVLGIFDDQTVSDATTVLAAVESAVDDDTEVVPVDKVPGVVVYATSDPSYLSELAGLPGGDPEQIDALTVPVPVDMSDPDSRIASYRVMLSEDILGQDPESFGRLVRHELTHVLLGRRGHGAPLWLTEGIAEYVSVQPMPESERQLPAGAMTLVAGGLSELPSDEVFSGPDARAWYAVAWWICEYVARDYSQSTLFWLLDELSGGTDPTEVLHRVLGLTSAELAQRGAALMVSTYG
ncbi:hypothetical protein [Nocardioides panacisoli]|uniref:Peptidase MA-like domain-containing protein n=1 Tax=Nocardioides panacisoli TaxID=627624 RepID=A0ABP7J349_9ACTN